MYNIRKSIRMAIFLATISFSCISHAAAATIIADGCTQSNIQSAIVAAATGDVVIVPGGNCTWTSGIIIPDDKKLTVQGSKLESTLITYTGIDAAANLGRSESRLTGFNFTIPEGSSGYGVLVYGYGWRVDHCTFNNETENSLLGVLARGSSSYPDPAGLVDHCIFRNTRVVVFGDASLLAHKSWAKPLDLGTEKAVYIEDCQFEKTNFGNAVDANYGGSYVFRYNTVIDCYAEAHSVQANHRATRKWEIYNNLIKQVNNSMWTPFFLRGGTGVIFNNTVSGKWGQPTITFDNVRSCYDKIGGGLCNGGSDWDGNEPIELGGAGSHTADSGSLSLMDASKSWGADTLIGVYVYNLTDGSRGQITGNTNNTVTAILTGGKNNVWNIGDQYKITNGYPCRDQIGRSTDEYIWTVEAPFPRQQHEPTYVWNNKYNEQEMSVSQHSCNLSRSHIMPGRDYLTIERPGYIPYTYPHPLAQSDTAITAPSNLTIVK